MLINNNNYTIHLIFYTNQMGSPLHKCPLVIRNLTSVLGY